MAKIIDNKGSTFSLFKRSYQGGNLHEDTVKEIIELFTGQDDIQAPEGNEYTVIEVLDILSKNQERLSNFEIEDRFGKGREAPHPDFGKPRMDVTVIAQTYDPEGTTSFSKPTSLAAQILLLNASKIPDFDKTKLTYSVVHDLVVPLPDDGNDDTDDVHKILKSNFAFPEVSAQTGNENVNVEFLVSGTTLKTYLDNAPSNKLIVPIELRHNGVHIQTQRVEFNYTAQ